MRRKDNIRPLNISQSFEGYFEEVYAKYFRPLYLYARSIAKSDDVAKDVVSDVFFNLWKSQHDLHQITELKAYLFRSVKNQVIRVLSHDPKNFNSGYTESYVQEIEKVNPEEILLEKELIELIQSAVNRLPSQRRLIFEMAKERQMKYAEIALELDISISTVKTQVARAIAAIKEAIENDYGNEVKQPYKQIGLGLIVLILSHLFQLSFY